MNDSKEAIDKLRDKFYKAFCVPAKLLMYENQTYRNLLFTASEHEKRLAIEKRYESGKGQINCKYMYRLSSLNIIICECAEKCEYSDGPYWICKRLETGEDYE